MRLLFLNLLLVGAGLILLLLIRALPRIGESEPLQRGVLERWLTSRFPERIDVFARAVFLRTLRRVKVLTLRVDNGINQKLQSMRLESGESIRRGEKAEKIDLKRVSTRRVRVKAAVQKEEGTEEKFSVAE